LNKTVLINFIILTNFIFSQCDNYNVTQCSNDDNCEWVEDFNNYSCSGFSQNQCYQYDGCDWTLSYGGSYGEWSHSCSGSYQIDDSYCQEIEMPECSELDQNTCNHPLYGEGCEWINGEVDCADLNTEFNCSSNNCDWVEDISSFNCAQFGSSSSCSNYSDYGCSWEFSWGGWGNHGSSCVGGSFQIDNSYCEGESGECAESSDIFGDMNYDGIINVQDAIYIIELVLNQQYNMLADMNYDNTVNVADVIIIINIILNDS